MRPPPPHGAQSAPWGPRRNGVTSEERGPHRASCARWGAIPGVFERGATQPDPGPPTRQPRWGGGGMQRRPNAAGVSPRAAKTDRAIIHVLNRVAFGPRPGDLDKVRAIGIDRYIEQQLHPERVADTGVDRRLAALTTIGMSSREIAERFEAPMLQARHARRAAAADSSAPSGVPSAAAGLGAP